MTKQLSISHFIKLHSIYLQGAAKHWAAFNYKSLRMLSVI